MTLRRCAVALLALIASLFALAVPATASSAHPPAQGGKPHGPSWQLLDTGSTSHFRGLAAVSARVAWISGYTGTILRTVDGGKHWTDVSPAGADTLQFRDISATDGNHAVAMAAGSGTDSRLYQTSDGGRHWTLAYENTNPDAFFDCMAFYGGDGRPFGRGSADQHGLVVSDPVGGKFRILSTTDGGRHWTVLPNAGMPAALTNEFGFAASGECLTTSGRDAWFGAGGGTTSRIFHSRDGGLHWTVQSTPIVSSASAGVFGLAFRTPLFGIAVGGDFAAPTAAVNVSATSFFSGPWVTAKAEPSGYRSGVSWIPFTFASAIAVGLSGSDLTVDGGRHWSTFDTGQFDTVSCTPDGACWASGDLGRVAKLRR